MKCPNCNHLTMYHDGSGCKQPTCDCKGTGRLLRGETGVPWYVPAGKIIGTLLLGPWVQKLKLNKLILIGSIIVISYLVVAYYYKIPAGVDLLQFSQFLASSSPLAGIIVFVAVIGGLSVYLAYTVYKIFSSASKIR